MAVTMKKVARRAGVSISTVSRVLSGRLRVREEVSCKVKQVMEELGYTPNLIAKSLVSRSANCLCIVLPRSSGQVFASLLFMDTTRGIVAEAARLGYDIQISSGGNEQEELEAVSGLLKGHRVDGVILPPGGEAAIAGYLRDSGYPYVLVGDCAGDAGLLSAELELDLSALTAGESRIPNGYELGILAARILIEKIRLNHWECKYG